MTDQPEPTPQEKLTTELRRVLNLRNQKAELQTRAAEIHAKMNASELGKQIASIGLEMLALNEALSAAETAARLFAVEVYRMTGEKKMIGATVKMFDTVEIKDRKKALWWSIQNVPDAVILDEKKFAAAAKHLQLDFVSITEEPKGQISSDLNKFSSAFGDPVYPQFPSPGTETPRVTTGNDVVPLVWDDVAAPDSD